MSLLLLSGLLLITFSSVAAHDRFWFLGLAMASALSFVVTALSVEEIEILLKKDREHSKSRLVHIEKLSVLQKQWASEKEKLLADLNWNNEQRRLGEISRHGMLKTGN